MTTQGLQVNTVSLGQGARTWIRDDAFSVAPGEVLTIMGPSGSGKSSLLAAIAGTLGNVSVDLEPLTFVGDVRLHSKVITHLPAHQRGIGLVYQEALLFAHMTVAENLLFAVPQRMPRVERAATIQAALTEIELADFGDRDPGTLSGGQRARVAIMRALLAKPKAILLDEPFAQLDETLRAQMRAWVYAQVNARGIPAVLVTHDRRDIPASGRVHTLQREATHVG